GRTIPVTTREGLPSNDTGPVMQDRHGVVWVGTIGAGLCRYDGKEFTPVTDELPSQVILSLREGSDGVIWVGTDKGLARMRDGRVEEMYLTDLPGVKVASMLWDSK